MSIPPPDSPRGNAARGRLPNWRERYDAARARGVPLDPRSEPVEGVDAYPTAYDPDHLLITARDDIVDVYNALVDAARDFGWGVVVETIDGERTYGTVDLRRGGEAFERARRARREFDLPTVYRVRIFRSPREGVDDQPVPPVDAWRLLQRARKRRQDNMSKIDLGGVSLDHIITIDPVGIRTNPFGFTNPVGIRTNPVGIRTNPFGNANMTGTESYGFPGTGGRQVVSYIGPPPRRELKLAKKGRRPVVAIMDTGCGVHSWLPDDIVTRYPALENRVIGVTEPTTDPEIVGDVSGPFDGAIDDSAGHGTFIAGIVRQVCPEADIVAIRVADSQGSVLEGEFVVAVRSLVKWMALAPAKGGRQIDVINLSLGYYHETPQDEWFDQTLSDLLVAARKRGCAVVCSAGNDATDRPSFPAALWGWPDADFVVADPADAAPHVSVGALNPNGTMALFSNMGPWVRTFAPGAAVLSSHPGFVGGVQAGTRDDRSGVRRETIDPDDFRGGFAMWSGTSFAAPYVAGMLARAIATDSMAGTLGKASKRVSVMKDAAAAAQQHLSTLGPTAIG